MLRELIMTNTTPAAEHPYSARLEATEMVGGEGATAPRITLTHIKNSIASVRYINAGDAVDAPAADPLHLMTVCFVTTWAGFTVIGHSAPMSADNFSDEKGRLFAYEDAVAKLWPLHAFHALETRP